MDIKWSQKSINELIEVVYYLKKNKLGELLENFANYFIHKHLKSLKIEDYTMDFSDDKVDTSNIGNGEYRLAFICELVNSFSKPFPHLPSLIIKKGKFKNVYSSLEYIIKFGIYKSIQYFSKFPKPNFTGYYLTNLLRDIFIPNRIMNKDDPYLNILNFSYFLTTEIMKCENENPGTIYKLNILMTDAQNLDLTILSIKSNRELHEILKTKRTIYVRILLILTNEIINIHDILEPRWLLNKIKISNKDELIKVSNSSLVETIIMLTSNRLRKKK